MQLLVLNGRGFHPYFPLSLKASSSLLALTVVMAVFGVQKYYLNW